MELTNEQLWRAVLGEIELNVSRANFSTWLQNTFIYSISESSITVGVPNDFVKSWIESKFKKELLLTLEKTIGRKIKELNFKIEKKKPSSSFQSQTQSQSNLNHSVTPNIGFSQSSTKPLQSLNPKYTFQNFIKGKGNELAYAAAQAVVQSPGKAYNPLFIYGGVGLGKTHLLQAIGNELTKHTSKVLYSTSETFTNEYLGMIKGGHAKEFKQKYRGVDILIVDDVQFMGGKDGTQQEFFHTFNELYNIDKQIILASDRTPKAIPALEQRLLSRFEWGMIADVVQPDTETKVAILATKCQEKNFFLDYELLHYIVSGVETNIRELEGVLNRVIAYHQFQKTQPTKESIGSIITNITANRQTKTKSPEIIIKTVSQYFEIKHDDLIGKCRKKEWVVPRQITMYLLREECGSSYPTIGNELGGRDHTTAMHAYNKISEEYKINVKTQHDINSIKRTLLEMCTNC